jgi:putative DNA primase/helicase
MTSYAGRLRRQGLSEREILAASFVRNKTVCEPPLDENEVRTIVRSITRYEPSDPIATVSDTPTEYADEDNAKRLISLHGEDVRFTEGLGWLVWEQQRWVRDAKSIVMLRKAFDVAKVIRKEAERASDEREHKKILIEVRKAGSVRNATDTVKAASSVAGIKLPDSAFDNDPYLFNVQNGTIDLRTGILRAHERSDYITKLAPVTYNQRAEAPRFMQFLDETFGDPKLIAFMQRLLGYCLTGDVSEQIFVIFWGVGGNGKSTLIEDVMRPVMGWDYVTQLSTDAISGGKFANQTSTANAALLGKRFATASESGARKTLDEENVKRITGGDAIRAKFLYRDEFDFMPTHKVILITNEKPRISASKALARRLLLVPFEHEVLPQDIDKKLDAKLHAEASGILNWLIQGCLAWQRIGLKPPEHVLAATEEYREEEDYLGQFVKEMCVIQPARSIKVDDIYRMYALWCADLGLHPLGKIRLNRQLTERFNNVSMYRSNGYRRIRGIGKLKKA